MTMIATFRFLVLVIVLAVTGTAEEINVDDDFWFACSGGSVDKVREFLAEHPDWLDATTKDGESCLHLAAIPGSAEVTKLLLDAGANPNVRSTFSGGLRMHPLSWNVYGGHYENVKLLLENGAEVNADIDSGESSIAITVLDANAKFLDTSSSTGKPSPHSEVYKKIQKLLLEHGGKRYAELEKDL